MVSTKIGNLNWITISILCLVAIMTNSSPLQAMQTQIIRLDPLVVPLRYKLELIIDPNSDGFSGDADIEISLVSIQKRIVLHSLGLQFDVVEIRDTSSKQIAKVTELASDGTVALDVPNEIAAGKVSLHFKYRATYSTGLEGLYKVTDENVNSVFTQFQAIGARRAFPCFDEPGFKAPFEISVISPRKYQVISNASETGLEKPDRKQITHHFAMTKPLPTYLIALAVGDFDIVTHAPIAASKLRIHTIPLRGVAMRGRGGELKAALDVTSKLLLIEEKYFGIAYPFDKLDIIAAPDFGAGGMENAGAITYDENLVLLSDDATFQRRREFLTTHAHEIAHQWFGNLVTPKWWDDLWLNESFASLMETKFASQIEPEWRFETDVLKNTHEAMLLDGASSVRRVREPVTSVDGITAAFDAITYQKGAAILAMVETTLGEAEFQSFVHKFLKMHAFKATDSQDFTHALRAAKNGDLAASILSSFIENPGLPVVTTKTVRYSTEVVQARFLSKNIGASALWTLPRNAGLGTGYYIHNLSSAEWEKTLKEIPQMPRAQALAIAINFDLAFVDDRISLQDYLNGVKNFAKHPDWEVAGFALERLEFIENETAPNSPTRKIAQRLICDLYCPVLTKIGIITSLECNGIESWISELKREHLVEFFASSGASPRLKSELAKLGASLIKQISKSLDENDKVPIDVIEAALIAASETGGDVFLQKSIARLKTSDDGYEREIWLHTIAASRAVNSSAEIEKLLLSDDIRNQEVPALLFARATIPAYRSETWAIVNRNSQVLLKRLNGDLEITLIQIADVFASEELAKRVETTITPLLGTLRGGEVQLKQTLERIRMNAAIAARFSS